MVCLSATESFSTVFSIDSIVWWLPRLSITLRISGSDIQAVPMESVYYYVPLFTILGCLISQGNCIKCYICSFSPDDRNNRTDKCTEDNFQHVNVTSDDCKIGCESFVQYDSNDEMEQWRRNCLHDSQKLTNDCQVQKTSWYRRVHCTCDKDLCNTSNAVLSTYVHFVSAMMALLWNWHSKL